MKVMTTIKNSKGEVLFEGTEQLVSDILNRIIDTQLILDEEGNKGKYDENTLIEDCIQQEIQYVEEHVGFETASEVKDFRKSFKTYF